MSVPIVAIYEYGSLLPLILQPILKRDKLKKKRIKREGGTSVCIKLGKQSRED